MPECKLRGWYVPFQCSDTSSGSYGSAMLLPFRIETVIYVYHFITRTAFDVVQIDVEENDLLRGRP